MKVHATWMCDNVLRTYSTTNMHVFKLVLYCITCLHSHGQDKPLRQQYVCMYSRYVRITICALSISLYSVKHEKKNYLRMNCSKKYSTYIPTELKRLSLTIYGINQVNMTLENKKYICPFFSHLICTLPFFLILGVVVPKSCISLDLSYFDYRENVNVFVDVLIYS